jgi:hypothetical protein
MGTGGGAGRATHDLGGQVRPDGVAVAKEHAHVRCGRMSLHKPMGGAGVRPLSPGLGACAGAFVRARTARPSRWGSLSAAA